MQYVRIPEDRVAVLIGEGGSTKRELEKRTGCRISLAEGEVSVEGEPLNEWVGKDVVHAIGRGFSPEKAMHLLKEGNVFDMVDLKDYAESPASRERLRGRIIGEKGRTRKFIERTSGAMIYINPDHVDGLFPDPDRGDRSLLWLTGWECSVDIVGTPAEIAEKLADGAVRS